MKFKFCPQCGSGLKPKMAGDDGEVPFCYECTDIGLTVLRAV